jgi:hypothetical protein
MRFSIRDLLLVVTLLAVGCAALKFAGGLWWSILAAASLAAFMAAVIVAFVGHGDQRAFAIGYATCAIIYGSLVYLSQAKELEPYANAYDVRLPTTAALQPIFRLVNRGRYVDLLTGKEIPNYVPPQSSGGFLASSGGGFGGGGMSTPTYIDSISRQHFMLIGHLLWSVAISAIGGRFARFIYLGKREQQQKQGCV